MPVAVVRGKHRQQGDLISLKKSGDTRIQRDRQAGDFVSLEIRVDTHRQVNRQTAR
jgi:hypothetical protein